MTLHMQEIRAFNSEIAVKKPLCNTLIVHYPRTEIQSTPNACYALSIRLAPGPAPHLTSINSRGSIWLCIT